MRSAEDMIDVFHRYESSAGIIGVALGNKEPGDPKSKRTLTFIVPEKLPKRGGRKTVANGRLLLPETTKLGTERLPTDVIEAQSLARRSNTVTESGPRFFAGSPVSNRTATGTVGCFVRRQGDPRVYLITNRHVAIGTGNSVYLPMYSPGSLVATTQFDLDIVDDRRVLPFFSTSKGYVKLDVALAAIPTNKLGQFSMGIPAVGRPTTVYQPDYTSAEAYADSLIGTNVVSYSWNTRRREGTISHVLYTRRASTGSVIVTYCLLIQGTDGQNPSEARDSGKVWVRSVGNGEVELIGLHQGSVTRDGNRYAVATDFYAISRLLRVAPA